MLSVVHFEIPADDVERASKFYNMLFGWKPEKVPGPSEYWMIHTKTKEQGIDGGISRRKNPKEHIVDYIEVESIEDCLQKVEDLGGEIIDNKTAIPRMGWYAICKDTENNAFGIWQKDENAE